MANDGAGDTAERLADLVIRVAGDESVRTIEAVAATLARRATAGPSGASEACAPGLAEDPPAWRDERADLCRRIARRAVRGCLDHLIGGATAFHRIDADPEWARPLLPVAVFGSFLFYRIPDRGTPSHQQSETNDD